MPKALLPFNIELLNISPQSLALLKPVTSLDYYEASTGQLNDDGLFSVDIFGRVGDEARDTTFSYIDINTKVFHPQIYQALVKLKGLYKGIMAGSIYAKWDDAEKDFISSDELHGDTGYGFFMSHWKDINLKKNKSAVRSQRIDLVNKYKDRALTDKIMVSPAGLRDIEMSDDGRVIMNEVNSLYRKILAVSRTIGETNTNPNDSALNIPRNVIQQTFNSIYEYYTSMLEGKRGFVQNKWGSRKIASGTRNVISAMNASTAYLGGERSAKYTDCYVGIYQLAVALLPITVFRLKTKYLEDIFSFGDGQAKLVDPQTLKGEIVTIPNEEYDKWTTNEGLEAFVNNFGELSTRKSPIMVDDYYLALIYRGPDNTFRVFSDIDELPDHLDRKYVSPIDQTELLYLSGYEVWNDYHGFVTRYPVTGTGSIYPSTVYVKTTSEGEKRQELDVNWQPMGDAFTALEFPIKEINTYLNSVALPSQRLAGLGADFDCTSLES